MNKLDDMIAKALDAEERTLLAQYEERGLLGEFAGLFSGRLGFVNAMSAIAQTALFVGALYAAARFLAVGEVAAMLRWGGLSGLLMMAVGFIKLMQWSRFRPTASSAKSSASNCCSPAKNQAPNPLTNNFFRNFVTNGESQSSYLRRRRLAGAESKRWDDDG
jgi:hypothetical protein